MSAFVKKLVEQASLKKRAGISDTLKPDDVNPHLIFHYGIPCGSQLLAYDCTQQMLAVSTNDGRIKLFGKNGSQALLESSKALPSKFLQFIENQGILINVNCANHIEVWDVDSKCCSTLHQYEKEITSCVAMQHAPYLYIGDSAGNISIMRLDQEQGCIERMKYSIPFSESHGKNNVDDSRVSVKYILPQPAAETKRVLIIYCDGTIALWEIRESKVICSSMGTSSLHPLYHEKKKVTAACWACANGSKVAVGYSNGDLVLWSVLSPFDIKTGQERLNDSCESQIYPSCKLNLGYKADKIPISKLEWSEGDRKSSRLYVLGCCDNLSTNLLQVVLLSEYTDSRTIKLVLHLPESVSDLGIITSITDQKRHDSLLLLSKTSHVYTYDDCMIERYLVQCQKKSSPSLPKEVIVKMPYGDSSITVTKFITSIPCMSCSSNEDFNIVAKNIMPLFPFERRLKDGSSLNSTEFGSFSIAKNLLITGHDNGTINFWDASCPLFLLIASITQQNGDDLSASGIPLKALHFNYESRILVSGDQSGTVRIYTFKSEPFVPQSSIVAFQGNSKKGSNHIIHRMKLVKVNGSVLSINMTENLKQVAVGSDQGYVSLIDLDGPTVLYQRLIASELSKGIISIHFKTCSIHGFEKNVLIVAAKDSSVLTLEHDSGNIPSSDFIRPKKPSRALYTQILDGHGISNSYWNNGVTKQSLVLLCSERAVYVYSLSHLVQGIKKVLHKKKFNVSCYWASTFGSSNDGLVLLFTNGKIEIRSLPDLSLLKECLLRGFTVSTLKSFSVPDITASVSQDGELILVNGNQEMVFVSTLLHKAYRLLDSASQVIDKDLVGQKCISVAAPFIKEKRWGIFGSILKDNKGTKTKAEVEMDAEESTSIEEVRRTFSIINSPAEVETEEAERKEEDSDLDIDDIDIDDLKENSKEYPVIGGLRKQKITDKFQAIKGRLKHAKAKNEKPTTFDEPQDNKAGAVDQIKKKYGHSSSGVSESNVAIAARTKLSENLRKLQGINMKTTEMENTARSFSSMAKRLLQFAENEKKAS